MPWDGVVDALTGMPPGPPVTAQVLGPTVAIVEPHRFRNPPPQPGHEASIGNLLQWNMLGNYLGMPSVSSPSPWLPPNQGGCITPTEHHVSESRSPVVDTPMVLFTCLSLGMLLLPLVLVLDLNRLKPIADLPVEGARVVPYTEVNQNTGHVNPPAPPGPAHHEALPAQGGAGAVGRATDEAAIVITDEEHPAEVAFEHHHPGTPSLKSSQTGIGSTRKVGVGQLSPEGGGVFRFMVPTYAVGHLPQEPCQSPLPFVHAH